MKFIISLVLWIQILHVSSGQKAYCDGEPPQSENAIPVVNRREAGSVIWYRCKPKYFKFNVGFVQCVAGSWKGNPGICKDSRCYSKDLNVEGVVVESTVVVHDRQWVEVKCDSMYEASDSEDARIYCAKGKWVVNSRLCIPVACRDDPPVPENGRVTFLPTTPGSSVNYECDDWFELQEPYHITCQSGKWEGVLPSCRDTRCYLWNLPENEGVDLSDETPIYPSDDVKVKCLKGYSLEFSKISCFDGVLIAENVLSPCQKDIEEKEEPAEFICPFPYFGVYPHSRDCSKYYLCLFSRPFIDRCQDSLLFDITTGACIEEESVDCGERVRNEGENDCHIPAISNGRIFQRQQQSLYKWTQLVEGEKLGEDLAVLLICNEHYNAVNNGSQSTAKIICRGGKLSPEPTCIPVAPQMEEEIMKQEVKFCSLESLLAILPRNSVPLLEGTSDSFLGGSNVKLQCPLSALSTAGNAAAICDGEDKWILKHPCSPPCSLVSLLDALPNGIVPTGLTTEAPENVFHFGKQINLRCESPLMKVTGDEFAFCNENGKWNMGVTKCIKGCLPFTDSLSSNLLIFPEKQFYGLGDLVVLSCPVGKFLSSDFERIACLSSGWSETWFKETAPKCIDPEF